jgi:hypothetical protein
MLSSGPPLGWGSAGPVDEPCDEECDDDAETEEGGHRSGRLAGECLFVGHWTAETLGQEGEHPIDLFLEPATVPAQFQADCGGVKSKCVNEFHLLDPVSFEKWLQVHACAPQLY